MPVELKALHGVDRQVVGYGALLILAVAGVIGMNLHLGDRPARPSPNYRTNSPERKGKPKTLFFPRLGSGRYGRPIRI